jgi:pyruvate/2-oxoglutarate dehydrogenase complex dihydrolipoamide dehydrogenase (E3) component
MVSRAHRLVPNDHSNKEVSMSTPEQYDAIIIGSGEAGKYMAWHLGSQGQHIINIEDKRVGGACPNVACLPSKNVIHSRRHLHHRRAR